MVDYLLGTRMRADDDCVTCFQRNKRVKDCTWKSGIVGITAATSPTGSRIFLIPYALSSSTTITCLCVLCMHYKHTLLRNGS